MVYAGFFRRLAASFIDGLILILPSIVVGGGLSVPGGFGFGLILTFIYKPFFESSVLCATPGKALMGIIVVTENDQARLTFKQAVIRFFSSYISILICYIGYLMQPFTSKRQTLHDMISESIVIRKELPEMNYFTAWRDQLKDVFNKL